VLLVGVGAYWLYLWPEGHWGRSVTVLAWAGWVAVVATTLGLFWIDVAQAGRGLRDTIATANGSSLLLRLALLCLAWSWLLEVNRTYGGPSYRGMSAPKSFAGGAVLVLMPLTYLVSGGSVTGSWAAAKAVLMALHVDAMTLWLGGLVVVAAFVLPRNDRSEVRAALPRFTLVATACVAAIAVSVALHAAVQADGITQLLQSRHGVVAAAKVLASIALLWLGNHTLRSTDRRLEYAERAGGAGLQQSAVRSELLIVAAIVVLSAALVVVPT
jgi:copper transport protein